MNPDRFLKQTGWRKSVVGNQSVDRHGDPIPWLPYCVTRLLDERLHDGIDVWEWGCGSSTEWLASRCRNVSSIEHDKEWYKRMQKKLRSVRNVELGWFPRDTDKYKALYCSAISTVRRSYHCVVIDGRDRNECARLALYHMQFDGVIIWDNTDRARYATGIQHVLDKGWRRLALYGLGPIQKRGWECSIFYRPGNCLGI